jgi:hypothetical protein
VVQHGHRAESRSIKASHRRLTTHHPSGTRRTSRGSTEGR